MVSVAVVGVSGCASLNVTGLLDALRKAEQAGRTAGDGLQEPVLQPFLVGLRREPIVMQAGITAQPDAVAHELSAPDIVVIPGLDDALATSLAANRDWTQWLAKWSSCGSRVATSCTGAFLAAEAGLLDGRQATTHWIAAEEFRHRYPGVDLVVDQMIVDTGDVITSGGATTFLNLVIYLLERFGGHARAVRAAQVMLVDGDRRSQLPYIAFGSARAHRDDTVHAAQEFMERRLASRVSIDDVARQVAVSVRTLSRRFHAATGRTPTEYLSDARLSAARRFLETRQMSVTEIRQTVGYHDAAAFGRAFRKAVGMTPSDYRRRYGPPSRQT